MEYQSVLSLAPLRISFIGGGTDMPTFYNRFPGSVVSAAINKYVYVHVKRHDPLFQEKYRITYSEVEHTQDRSEIRNKIVRGCLEFLDIDEPLQISTSADLPANSGLGSSSSFAVALLNALHALKGRHVSKVQLAEEASFVEIELLKSPIGKQDQYAAAFGGLNHFEFMEKNSVRIEPIYLADSGTEEFLSNSLMLWTGQQRDANTVLGDQEARINDNYRNLIELTKLSSMFRNELIDGTSDWRKLAEIMKQGWSLKQKLSDKISTPAVETIISSLESNSGCIGYKLLGAGGGGFVLAIFEKGRDCLSVREQWPSFVPSIDFSGSRIVSVN